VLLVAYAYFAHTFQRFTNGMQKVKPDDTSRDDLLQRALTAASRAIDRACGRRFWLDPTAVQRNYNPWRGRVVREADGEILLTDDIGDTTGLAMETGTPAGGVRTAVTGWETVPDKALADGQPITGLLRPMGIWTWSTTSTTRMRVTTRFGWPAVPDEVEQATLIQASRLFKRKDSPEGSWARPSGAWCACPAVTRTCGT
jgi:hypothetical protein